MKPKVRTARRVLWRDQSGVSQSLRRAVAAKLIGPFPASFDPFGVDRSNPSHRDQE